MGDWMSDCLRDWAGADAAFQNAGGIRNDIAKGPVTLREIYEVMPFDNTLVVLRMAGRDVREVLDNGVSGGHGMVQVSGVDLVYDPKAPEGKRVVSARIGGKPLQDDQVYKVATSDFMTMGGDGYNGFAKAKETDKKDVLLREVLTQCARKGAIAPPPSGRLHAGGL